MFQYVYQLFATCAGQDVFWETAAFHLWKESWLELWENPNWKFVCHNDDVQKDAEEPLCRAGW